MQAKIYASVVELWQDARCLARHERCYGRQQQVLDLEHYLDVLFRKPGALAGSRPLEQARRAGLWPESFDRLWEALREKQGRSRGTQQMIELLQLGRAHGRDRLQEAIEQALAAGCADPAAVRHLLQVQELQHVSCEPMEVGFLARYQRPLPALHEYDRLLAPGGAQ